MLEMHIYPIVTQRVARCSSAFGAAAIAANTTSYTSDVKEEHCRRNPQAPLNSTLQHKEYYETITVRLRLFVGKLDG
jgi:hypothetical protein